MRDELKPGLEATVIYAVEKKHLASTVGSGIVDVFSTAMMIGGMESAAVAAVQPALEDGETTVGIHVDVEHQAATPMGMKARFHATLLEVSSNGKGLLFHVEAYDDAGLIGKGAHRRVVVNREKFERKARAKLLGI